MTRLTATRKASKKLRGLMRHPWYVPLPLDPDEQRDFVRFIQRRGVTVREYGGLFDPGFEASEDLCPHARAWRIERGEAVPA